MYLTHQYHGFHLSTCTNEPFGEDLCARCEAVVKRHEIWNFNAWLYSEWIASYICLWFDVVLASQFWCKTFLLPSGLTAVVLCVSESLVSCIQHLVWSVGQSRGYRYIFVHQACVTANIASDQASAAEDELQHPCSTAGDKRISHIAYKQARRTVLIFFAR